MRLSRVFTMSYFQSGVGRCYFRERSWADEHSLGCESTLRLLNESDIVYL